MGEKVNLGKKKQDKRVAGFKVGAMADRKRDYELEDFYPLVQPKEFDCNIKRSINKIRSLAENGKLYDAICSFERLKGRAYRQKREINTVRAFMGILSSVVLCSVIPIGIAKRKSLNSPEITKQLDDYAVSQGFESYADYQRLVGENVLKVANGDKVEFVYTNDYYASNYIGWENALDEISSNAVDDLISQTIAEFYSCGAGVLVTLCCFSPYILSKVRAYKYDKEIEKLAKELAQNAENYQGKIKLPYCEDLEKYKDREM